MGEVRKDYIVERSVIVSSKAKKTHNSKKCPYCPGNESMTSPSLLSLVAKDGMLQRLQDSDDYFVKGWCVRVFESANPAVSTSAENSYSDRPLYSEPAYGYHYVVVVSSKHSDTLATIDIEQWSNVLVVIQDRLRWLYTQRGVSYVSIFVNHGKEAGSVVDHAHVNIVSFSNIPPIIDDESESSHKFLNEKGVCPMCQTVSTETGGPRQVLQTEGFIAFCPWAPSHQFEFWICPKKHTTQFSKITQKEINDLSLILRATLGGLLKNTKIVAFNLAFHLSPEKKNSRQIHWHIEVYPMTNFLSGLERGYGVFINPDSPEADAKILGAASRKELASLVGIE